MSLSQHLRPILICPAVFTLTFLALAGCTSLRTPYLPPEVNLPGQWTFHPADAPQSPVARRWWTIFNDPALETLIDKALATNNDLAAATIRLRRARLAAGLTATDLRPDLSVAINQNLTKHLDSGTSSKRLQTSIDLSWEPDLWGKLASSRDADEWEARATEEDRANTALSLVRTTADLYWQIAYLNQAIATSRESIDYTQKTLDLVAVRVEAGNASELERLQAGQSLASQKADLTDLMQQMTEARNSLTVLFDRAPGPVMADPKHLTEMVLPDLDPGIPAHVLKNRPDLRAAEFRLRETLADTDATRLSYYPNLNLTGGLGTGSKALAQLMENPVTTLGVGLTLPFVQWNEKNIRVGIAKENYKQAVTEFRQTLYEALKDVEDALSAKTNHMVRAKALRRSLDLAIRAERMAKIRYEAGKTSVQDWLDQQEIKRKADLALAINRYGQLNNLMTLYTALGGETERRP